MQSLGTNDPLLWIHSSILSVADNKSQAVWKRLVSTCEVAVILKQRRGELHWLQARLCLQTQSLHMKCPYLVISQWKLTLQVIPFLFLIMGFMPAVSLHCCSSPTTSGIYQGGKKRKKESKLFCKKYHLKEEKNPDDAFQWLSFMHCTNK